MSITRSSSVRAIAASGGMAKTLIKMPTLPASTMPIPAGVKGIVLSTAETSAVKITAEIPRKPGAGSI